MTLIPLLLHSLDKFLENKREKVNISENGTDIQVQFSFCVTMTNNDPQIATQTTKDWATWTQRKSEGAQKVVLIVLL